MIDERISRIRELSNQPLVDDKAIKRVEIIILKFKEAPEVIDECITRIIHNTDWPFKLNIFDNRFNPPNTSKIWNKLIKESSCDYIVIIDSDAFVPLLKPCWLTRLMESIEDKGVVIPFADNCGGSNKASAAKPYPNAQPQEGIWSGVCGLYKKSIFESIGYFDEDFLLYGQDSEFAYRCLKKMGGATFRADVLIRHIGSYSAKKEDSAGSFDREADKIYARHLFMKKTNGKK